MQTVHDVQTWHGRKMVDADGDKIGTIEDVFLDRQTGEPAWAAVKTGLFGHKHTLVPIRDAEPTGDNEVRVNLQKEKVKDAPRIDPGGELDARGGAKALGVLRPLGLRRVEGRRPHEGDGAARRGRRSAQESRATEAEAERRARVVGVRLRRVVVVAVPAGERRQNL